MRSTGEAGARIARVLDPRLVVSPTISSMSERCIGQRPSVAIPVLSILASPSPDVGVVFAAYGRGHALRRIDLYPVRAKALSSHNRYSRLPNARNRRWRTNLLRGRSRPSIFPVANRLAAGAASSVIPYQALSVA